ncbi:MAG TPA: metallophosphoesterase [Phycisphaerae bacterium]|nr:metallophosphoesterase [Phycisphaerae bacterium]
MEERKTTRRTFLKTAGAAAVTGLAAAKLACKRREVPHDPPARHLLTDWESDPLSELLAAPDAVFRPTASGCTLHWVPRGQVEVQVLAGTDESKLELARELASTDPTQVQLSGFPPDAELFYQCRYRRKGNGQWTARPVRRMHTARPPGSAYKVALIADTHLAMAQRKQQTEHKPRQNLKATIERVLADRPDFVIFLGDEPLTTSWYTADREMNQQLTCERWEFWRQFYVPLLQAVPSYLVIGNHEGEAGYQQIYLHGHWPLQRWATIARKTYYPNPLPDTYPEGGEDQGWRGDQNSEPTGGADQGNCSPLQNYFAWTWGDALFVVLDVQRYTNVGRGFPMSPDDWTLGQPQLQWLERVLTGSNARWKLVLGHHLMGGWNWGREGTKRPPEASAYARGGARYARVGEQARITDLMNRAGAQMFLYGHDHVFAHQQAEGIHFVCCGRPTKMPDRMQSTPGWKEAYGEASARNPHDFHLAVGYTRLSVAPHGVTVDYVRTGTDPSGRENVSIPVGGTVYQFSVT